MTNPKTVLRKRLFAALSALYAREVPLYDKLLETVRDVNGRIAARDPAQLPPGRTVDEISAERHGAIRLGKPDEMRDMARFFACLDMMPVNFYNLAEAGAKSQPVISTAFRPLRDADHRVFCSLLMTDSFTPAIRRRVEDALRERRIFSRALLRLIEASESEGGLTGGDADVFVSEATALFAWRGTARDHGLYRALVDARFNIAADIACFPNPHLNHLTPNTLDIDELYAEMTHRLNGPYAHLPHRGMKDSIEGPPRRSAPVLLRQTAYNALDEGVVFTEPDGSRVEATHRARFGEIEQRGVAMTPAGRRLYDEALAEADASGDKEHAFARIPDDLEALRREGLAYFRYLRVDSAASAHVPAGSLPEALANGIVTTDPIRYEDFLPVSAAGIFAANLGQYGTRPQADKTVSYTKERLESYLETTITEAYELYAAEETASIRDVIDGGGRTSFP
ncbi:MAG: DUF1338 family protein [Opitutales bacterium]|nr:DUF1338 family protein [Opitutales bacterium]